MSSGVFKNCCFSPVTCGQLNLTLLPIDVGSLPIPKVLSGDIDIPNHGVQPPKQYHKYRAPTDLFNQWQEFCNIYQKVLDKQLKSHFMRKILERS